MAKKVTVSFLILERRRLQDELRSTASVTHCLRHNPSLVASIELWTGGMLSLEGVSHRLRTAFNLAQRPEMSHIIDGCGKPPSLRSGFAELTHLRQDLVEAFRSR